MVVRDLCAYVCISLTSMTRAPTLRCDAIVENVENVLNGDPSRERDVHAVMMPSS